MITPFCHRFIAALLFVAALPACAASFDCARASSAQEKLICKSEQLSELDLQLDEAYRAAKSHSDSAKAKDLTAQQRQWLGNVRNRCKNADCLLKAYVGRLNEFDPLADKELTCAEMRKSPQLVFVNTIDLGSGSYSPTAVDYKCPESLSQQKFMQSLLGLAEKIRSEEGPQSCTGTIIHATWRFYHFRLAEAGFAPKLLRQDSAADERTLKYFRQWSESSLFNLALYKEFTSELERVLPVLANHYATSFEMSKQEARAAAGNALQVVVQRAAGAFPDDELKEDSALVQLVRDSRSKPDDIRRALGTEDDIYGALLVALINNRPLQTVSILADALSPASLQRVDGAKEALLSFALGSQPNLEYLLGKKAPPNAANDFGKTALFYAIAAGNEQAVQALIKAGADVNHAYKSAKELRPGGDECIYPGLVHTRRTPLMHAAQHSNVEMIRILLKAGARMAARDELGYNALDYAALAMKKDNEAYLKSLGLEFGSPKYSTDADPAVREQTIQARVPFDGYVSKLLTAPGRPALLVAAVKPWDHLSANERPGLYLLSIADPDHPRVLSHLPAANASDFALSPDGKRAYLMRRPGLSIVDLADQDKPDLSGQIEGDFTGMHLSPDGKLLYLQAADELQVHSVEAARTRLACRKPFGNVFAYRFASLPAEPLLLIYDRSGMLMLFDVKDPCQPVKLTETRAEFAEHMLGNPGRTMVSCASNALQKYRITDTLERMAGYEGPLAACHLDVPTGTVTAVVGQDVALFRPKGSSQYKLTDRFRFPNENLGGVLQSSTGHVYIGWNGGLGVGRVPRD